MEDTMDKKFLTEEQRKKVEIALIQHGLNKSELCKKHNIGLSYLSSMLHGDRPVSRHFATILLNYGINLKNEE